MVTCVPQVRTPPTGSRWLRGVTPVLVVVAGAALTAALLGGLKDLDVYQFGARRLLAGLPLVGSRDPAVGLPYTYPPFAAVLMSPLAVLPSRVAAALWTGASVGAVAGTVVVVRRALGRPSPGWLVAVLTVAAVALEPVWQTLAFGQVNLVLMVIVLVDLLGPQRRWSGVLVGVAAGVKLTPLVFVVMLLLIGRRRAAARALVTFTGTVVVGLLLTPGASAYWWPLAGLVSGRRVGPPALAHNQSAYGAMTRLLHGPPAVPLWLLVAAPLAGCALVVGVLWWRRGERALGVGLVALAMLIGSPVSWSHHWVWALPLALALWERHRFVAVAWTAVFVARPMVWLPYGRGREYSWGAVEHVLGNAYLLAAVALVVFLTSASRGWRNVDRLHPVHIHSRPASRG